MKLARDFVVALFALASVSACGAGDSVDTAARVGSQQFSATQLAEVMNTSQAPLDADVARSIAELWINYHLAGIAAARGDTITDTATMQLGLWRPLGDMRVQQLYDEVSKSWTVDTSISAQSRYDSGEIMSARHILVQVPADATPEVVETARRKAESIRAEVTPANFARLAARSDEPGAGDRGGDLGVFPRGQMVADFESAVLALRPGEISPVVRTSYGFHIILRKPFSEVSTEVEQMSRQQGLVAAESIFLAQIESTSQLKLSNNAAGKTKEVARNPLGSQDDNTTIADYAGGTLTASRLADWVTGFPPQAQVRPQLMNAEDSVAIRFVRQIVRNELLLLMADSANISIDPQERANLRMAFRNNLTTAWTVLGVDPSSLTDSAATPEAREALAAARINDYFLKLVRNEVPFADIAFPVSRALQSKFEFSLNDAGLMRAVERARQLRTAGDSTSGALPGATGDTTLNPPTN